MASYHAVWMSTMRCRPIHQLTRKSIYPVNAPTPVYDRR